jgi:hypothetical protein
LLVVHDVDSLFLGAVIKTNDTVGDALGLLDLDPTDFGTVVAVSTATGLSIEALDVDNSKLVARNDTSLVQMEAILPFGLSLVHEVLGDRFACVDDAIGGVLDFHLFIFRESLVVSDVQMGDFLSLLGTILPDMRTEDLTASSEDDVSAGVMSLQLLATALINLNGDFLALEHLNVAF